MLRHACHNLRCRFLRAFFIYFFCFLLLCLHGVCTLYISTFRLTPPCFNVSFCHCSFIKLSRKTQNPVRRRKSPAANRLHLGFCAALTKLQAATLRSSYVAAPFSRHAQLRCLAARISIPFSPKINILFNLQLH